MEKLGALLIYQLLDALYDGNTESLADNVKALDDWCASASGRFAGQEGFAAAHQPVSELHRRRISDEAIPMREYNSLRKPLVDLLISLLRDMQIVLYLTPDAPPRKTLPVRKDIKVVAFPGAAAKLPDPSDGRIDAVLAGNADSLDERMDALDMIILVHELYKRARYCYPMDSFDYDRLYLSGKLKSLTSINNNTSILFGGSSYAMVGLNESLMPRPAVNLAVNAQDPYYTFLSVRQAMRLCGKINSVVIAGGYYFWHTDMSDDPSDYYHSVLTRVNKPIFHKLHNYKGELSDRIKQANTDPLLEKIFDLHHICEKSDGNISVQLASLAYYNDEMYPRPEHGMLSYPIREQSEEVNDKAAKARAQAHNDNYNLAHLEDNIRELADFLTFTQKKRAKVFLLVPPVTAYYRRYSAPELKLSLYDAIAQCGQEASFEFIDLFDSPDFGVEDFQDYDHLNEQGAIKLSNIIAGLVG